MFIRTRLSKNFFFWLVTFLWLVRRDLLVHRGSQKINVYYSLLVSLELLVFASIVNVKPVFVYQVLHHQQNKYNTIYRHLGFDYLKLSPLWIVTIHSCWLHYKLSLTWVKCVMSLSKHRQAGVSSYILVWLPFLPKRLPKFFFFELLIFMINYLFCGLVEMVPWVLEDGSTTTFCCMVLHM